MAVPFLPSDEELEEHYFRLLAELYQVLHALLLRRRPQQPQEAAGPSSTAPTPAPRSRIPSCEDDDGVDDDEDDEPPPMSTVPEVVPVPQEAASRLQGYPDVVPTPAPRLSLPGASGVAAGPGVTPGKRRSPFTKYITDAVQEPSASAVLVSPTTVCYVQAQNHHPDLPDLVKPLPPRQTSRKTAKSRGARSKMWTPLVDHHQDEDELLEKTYSRMSSTATEWMVVGDELRRFADQFSESKAAQDEIDSACKLAVGPYDSSLVSLLLAPWTTGIFLLVGIGLCFSLKR